MKIIKESGYYLSEPFHYEDLHAGNKIEKLNYTAYWFFDRYVMKYGKSNSPEFTKSEFLSQGRKGVFEEKEEETLTIIFDQGSKFEVRGEFSIASPKVFKDGKGTEYHFVPW